MTFTYETLTGLIYAGVLASSAITLIFAAIVAYQVCK
jgi:hypothetical protein